MAIINCPECHNSISDTSSKCHRCGYVLVAPSRSIFGRMCKWAFFIFNALMLYIFCIVATNVPAMPEQIESQSAAYQSGAVVGTIIGGGIVFGTILAVWMIGAIILGLFALITRPIG
jgi:hypothetical protein